ncbi:unnamed protein product, partial [Brassica rapa subsp. trilocularis]
EPCVEARIICSLSLSVSRCLSDSSRLALWGLLTFTIC